MRPILVDSKSCNIFKFTNLFKYLNLDFLIIDKPIKTSKNDYIVLPGVGNFGFFSKNIEKLQLTDFILDHINNDRPIIGICVGMQYFFSKSEEDLSYKGLGVIKGDVKKIRGTQKIPVVGTYPVKLGDNNKFFFMHSYYCELKQEVDISIYNEELNYLSYFRHKNIIGVQFHPEVSGINGLNFFKNIFELK